MVEIEVAANTRTRIYRRYGNSLPGRVAFDVSSSAPVSGTVEVEGSLFGRNREPADLRATNVVDKGFWDSKFSIWVTPDNDATVTRHKRVADGLPRLALLLGFVVVVAVVAALVPLLLN